MPTETCSESCQPLAERVARTEKAVQGLESRMGEIVEWKHHSLPAVLAEMSLATEDVRERLDAHLVFAAEKVAIYDEVAKKANDLDDAVHGKAGLALSVMRMSGQVEHQAQTATEMKESLRDFREEFKELDVMIRAKKTKADAVRDVVLGSGWLIALLASAFQVWDWFK